MRDVWQTREEDGLQQSHAHPQAERGRQRGVTDRSLALLRPGAEFNSFNEIRFILRDSKLYSRG